MKDLATRYGTDRIGNLDCAGQFVTLCKDILLSQGKLSWGGLQEKYAGLAHHGRIESFAKAAQAAVSLDATWSTSDGTILAEAYIQNVASSNLVDAVKRYAYPIPNFQQPILIASGVIAEDVNEGAGKVVSPLNIDAEEAEDYKTACMLVITKELLAVKSSAADALFRKLMRDAVITASNAGLLTRLPRINVAAGSTAVASLQNGLTAAEDSNGYVVAATPSMTKQLALASDGRMGVNGGEFIPDVVVLPALEATSGGPDLVVIPASKLAIEDLGLVVRSAGHADVQMETAPTVNSVTPTGVQMVSLWQANLLGLLCERRVRIRGASPAVEVG